MKTLLIGDDDPNVRQLLLYKLRNNGYKVLLAEHGEDAVNQAREHTPDLVVLDLMMPFLDGLSALREIRAMESMRGKPVIILSSKNREEDIIGCLEAGANDFIIKPYSPNEVLVRIRRLLGELG
jgi:two-component system response regulator MtrA